MREQRAVNLRRFLSNRLSVIGLCIVTLMLLTALLAPVVTGAMGLDPYSAVVRDRLKPPSAAHPFGTDNLGRDIFARVLYGARISMTIGLVVGLLSAIIGETGIWMAIPIGWVLADATGLLYMRTKGGKPAGI